MEADRERVGYIPNYSRLFAHRPAVYRAWRQLITAISENIAPRRYELATVAAARRLRSSYCLLAHGNVLRDSLLEPETVSDLARDHRSAGLPEVDVAVMDFAEKIAADASSISKSDVDELREVGLTDIEIFEVALAASARCFFSKTVDALGVEAHAVFVELEPELRDALVVGRPIATSPSG